MEPLSHHDSILATIQNNVYNIKLRMARAAQRAGRAPESVKLIAVTKSAGFKETLILYQLGITDFGENRPDKAAAKMAEMPKTATWHMIGSVQRRKAADVVTLFDVVDSVDRVEMIHALEQRCEQLGKSLRVLLEVNVSGEASKHGFAPHEVDSALHAAAACSHLKVEGLMTMAPLVNDPEEVRPVFARLRDLAHGLGLSELSMGMSNDFEVAIEEGATQVRIGTALFE